MFNNEKYEPFILSEHYEQDTVSGKTLLNVTGKGFICYYFVRLTTGYYSASVDLEIKADGSTIQRRMNYDNYNITTVLDKNYFSVFQIDRSGINFKVYDNLLEYMKNSLYMFGHQKQTLDSFFKSLSYSDSGEAISAFIKPFEFNNSFLFKVVSYNDGNRNNSNYADLYINILGFKIK